MQRWQISCGTPHLSCPYSPMPCPGTGCYKAELVHTTVKFTPNYPEIWNSKRAIITNSSPKAAITTFHTIRPQSQTYPYTLPFPRFLFCSTIKWPPVKNTFFFFFSGMEVPQNLKKLQHLHSSLMTAVKLNTSHLDNFYAFRGSTRSAWHILCHAKKYTMEKEHKSMQESWGQLPCNNCIKESFIRS